MFMDNIIAHINADKNGELKQQSLKEHLLNVALACQKAGKNSQLGWLTYLIGAFHDLGKAGQFQEYIRGSRLRINHSTAGASFLFNKGKIFLQNDLKHTGFLNALILPILQHHGLINIIDLTFPAEIRGQKCHLYSYYRLLQTNSDEDNRQVMQYGEEFASKLVLPLNAIMVAAHQEWQMLERKIENLAAVHDSEREKNVAINYYRGCVVRLLLSILKDADIYDATNYFREAADHRFSSEELQAVWLDGVENIETAASKYEKLSAQSHLNKIRRELSQECKSAASKRRQGILKLELPTGAGKTASVLRFALHHASHFADQRIIYTTAFLSVLEQSARTIQNILKEPDYILEHHSNVVLEEHEERYTKDESQRDKSESDLRHYLIESWEEPIILTTLVQLTNTLFGGKSSQLRRFSKLMNSVIIMDEVQSLPLKVIYNINLMSNFLSTVMGATIIHCTATEPVYDNAAIRFPINYAEIYPQTSSIASVKSEDIAVFDRVEYFSLLGSLANQRLSVTNLIEHILAEMQVADSCLIICNKKTEVKHFYDALSVLENIRVVYLTTNLCPKHRLDIIESLDELLTNNRQGNINKLICISTQLIEAGVDLDFDLVYREAAGLDSLIQSAGRCNREGKRMVNNQPAKGKCFSFILQEDDLKNLPEIEKAQKAFISSVRQFPFKERMDNPQILKDAYFTRYYGDNEKQMNYMVQNTSILELLSDNKTLLEDYKTKIAAPDENASQQFRVFHYYQNFKTASHVFRLIDEKETYAVLVPYKNNELLNSLFIAEETGSWTQAKKIISHASQYTIQIPTRIVEEHGEAFVKVFNGLILLLSDEHYDPVVGLKFNESIYKELLLY